MKGISRRTRACAAVAATGVAVLASAATAQAQRPATVGEGVPTGQSSVQLFNYGTYISNGGNTGAANPVTGVSTACTTDQSTACRWERLDRLFAFLARKGVTSVELFGHAGLPANDAIEGEFGWKAYRTMLDRNGLHAAGWHGSMNEAAWPARVAAAKVVGMDFIGSGGVGDPGVGSYENTLRTAETLNRLGKYSVENGVGPVYIHNHTGEFDAKYVHNGVLTTAFDILMERTDPRYVTAEVDIFWSSDAFNDATGELSAALINKWPSRVRMLHMKDGINVTSQPSPTNSRGGSPRAFGTGEVDFRPVLLAAKNRVQYYHQEHDGGTTTDADTSLTNLKGTGASVVGTVLGLPTTFPSVAAGTAAATNSVAITIQNTGDAPLTITGVGLASSNTAGQPNSVQADESPADFAVLSNTCVGTPLAPGAPATDTAPAVARGTCVVNVGFKPTKTNHRSVSRLIVTSNADAATEAILLTGQSTGEAVGTVGGNVPSLLSLTLSGAASFGAFVPATARTYDASSAASVVSTAGDAKLTVADAAGDANAGKLVNGAFALSQPLQIRAQNAAVTNAAFTALGATPLDLLTYSAPTAGADTVTIGFRQVIAANEVLRAGSYGKTLTFTLSTTTP